MPKFHFQIANGHTIEDPIGLDCKSEEQAKMVAKDIARQIALEVSGAAVRHVVVVDEEGTELFKAPIKL
jgi:hypothetical protein